MSQAAECSAQLGVISTFIILRLLAHAICRNVCRDSAYREQQNCDLVSGLRKERQAD